MNYFRSKRWFCAELKNKEYSYIHQSVGELISTYNISDTRHLIEGLIDDKQTSYNGICLALISGDEKLLEKAEKVYSDNYIQLQNTTAVYYENKLLIDTIRDKLPEHVLKGSLAGAKILMLAVNSKSFFRGEPKPVKGSDSEKFTKGLEETLSIFSYEHNVDLLKEAREMLKEAKNLNLITGANLSKLNKVRKIIN